MVNEASYSSLGKTPISEAQPTGNDVRDESDYELLQAEIGKMSNPTTSATLDWNRVVTLAANLLRDKGKDVMVAAYLTGGLLQTAGLPGLRDGVTALNDMLTLYWDSIFPPVQRLRGRRNALQWLIDHVSAYGGEGGWSSLPPQEESLVAELRNALQSIDAVLSEKDEDAPSMRSLLALVNNLPVIVAAPPPAPAPAEAPTPAPSPAAAPAPVAAQPAQNTVSGAPSTPLPQSASTALDDNANAEQVTEELFGRIAAVSEWLGNASLSNPLAFRLNRIAAWGMLEVLPPTMNGQSMVPAPIPQVQDVLQKLVAEQAGEDLVRFAEAQLPLRPFWLDLNYVCAQALQRLGPGYAAARIEVCGETRRLLERFPGIEKMAFANGQAFANEETQSWLASLTQGDGGAADAGAQADPLQAGIVRAKAMAKMDLAGAADLLQGLIDKTDSPRGKLRLRIELCAMLFSQRPTANLKAFALAIVTEIDRHALTGWEPELALEGLQAAYHVIARAQEDEGEANALLARIAALHPGSAVKLVT